MTIIKQTLPKDWRWRKLSDCATKIGSGITPLGGHANYLNSGIPLIRSQNVHMNQFSYEGLAYISLEQDEQMNKSRVFTGDVLLNITGASIGRVCVVPLSVCPANVNQHVCVIRCSDDVVAEFLSFYLSNPNFQKHILGMQSGATRQALTKEQIENFLIPIPPLDEQKRIATCLNEQMHQVEQARQGIEEQLSLLTNLVNSYFRESLQRKTTKMHLSDCMVEVKKGVGETWTQYPVLGATRAGVAPAKEKVGKQPQRYKLVEPGTIFYNPMRIMIGSIAMLDDGDESGITSPDYVVLKGKEGILHPRWFYYWFRSPYGENFIKSLARGAVRERMLFNRLDKGEIELPDWETQVKIAEKLKEIKTFRQALEAQLAEINELPSALLRQAFAGGV